MNDPVGRRALLARIGAAAVASSCGAPLSAQIKASVSDLERLLGRKVPEPLSALLPGEVLEGAAFIRRLLSLEAEAKALRLPPSILSLGESSLPLDADRLYELALPRAVALIDRSEFRNLPFANKAGELLALLHRSQHEPPEAFRAFEPTLPGAPQILSLGGQGPAATAIALPEPAEPDPAELAITRSVRFDLLAEEYAAHYRAAELKADHQPSFDWHLAMMRKSKPRYQGLAAATGVPWYFIGIVHAMEASFNFRAHLHNGDFPLGARTRQVRRCAGCRRATGNRVRATPCGSWALPGHRTGACRGFSTGLRRSTASDTGAWASLRPICGASPATTRRANLSPMAVTRQRRDRSSAAAGRCSRCLKRRAK